MVREHNFLVDFFGLLKKQNDARSSLILNLAQSNETEVLAMWQSDLNIPHEIFKDPKAGTHLLICRKKNSRDSFGTI